MSTEQSATDRQPLDLAEIRAELDEIGVGDGAAGGILAEKLLGEVERLTAERDESDVLRGRMADLLTGTANALKGTPDALTSHDWSDLPAVAQHLKRAVTVRNVEVRDAGQLREAAEAERDAVAAELAAARRELATLAEKIATAIEAKRGPAQSARYVAALTRAADIARTFGVQPGTGSEPTDRFRLAEWNELPDECFVDGCDATEIDQRGPVWIRDGLMRKACTEHWEPIMRVLGEQVSWQKTDAMRAVPAAGLPEQDGEAEPPESLPTGSDETGSPDTWSTTQSITEEQQ